MKFPWHGGLAVVQPVRAFILALVAAFSIAAAPANTGAPWSQLADPVFVRVDTRELPEAYATSFAQDAAGFLWVGTQGGFARFDGYHFKSYVPNPMDAHALADGYVHTMVAQGARSVWLGTNSAGLVRFDEPTQTFRTWRGRSASVHALVLSGTRLWVGGDGGLETFDVQNNMFQRIVLGRGGKQPEVRSLLIDGNRVWAGTSDGLFTGRVQDARLQRFTLGGGAAPDAQIWSLYKDSAKRLWIGSVGALYVLDQARRLTGSFISSAEDAQSLASGEQRTLIEVAPGVMWAGSAEVGLSIVDFNNRRVRRITPNPNDPSGLTAGQVLQFFRDRSGLLWIADQAGGLLLYNPFSHGIHHLSGVRPQIGLSDLGAVAIAAAPGERLWAGGSHGSLVLLDPHAARSRNAVVPNRSIVVSLSVAHDGTLWIGTLRGLCALRTKAAQPQCPAGPKQIASARVDASLDSDDTLWIGTRNGLLAQNERSGAVRMFRHDGSPHSLTNDWVTALRRDRAGNIWAGTVSGLNRIDPRTWQVTRFAHDPARADSVGGGRITSILDDRRGRVWAGALGGPLNVLSVTGSGVNVRHLGLADGLPHGNVDGLAQDTAGRIWMSPDRALGQIAPDGMQARGLSTADGVSDASDWAGSVAQSAQGTIFFGAVGGVTVITPGASSNWNYAPPLVITSLMLGRQPAAAGNAQIPYDHRDITVEFAALDYSAPQTLRYAYKLDGYDRDWNQTDSTHRVATYTNLPPGDYTLRVRATNRLGVWSGRELALHFEAQAAWYETWWFRTLLLLLLLAAGYAVVMLRTKFLIHRQRELEEIVEARTRDLTKAYAAVEEMSLTDPLTALRNRRFLTQNIGDEVALARRRYLDWAQSGRGELPSDADLIFFLIDIDNFKEVNDDYGHAAGDQLLAQMRTRLEAVFRETDYLVRWGGEEFLAVARRSRRSDAPDVCERLRVAIESQPFVLEDGKTLSKTASIGFAALPFIPEAPDAIGWLRVVEIADEALFMAKRAGRNRWCGALANEKTAAALALSPRITADELARAGALQIVTAADAIRT